MTDLIDRTALVDFMERVLARLQNNPDVSESCVSGYKTALAEVKCAAPMSPVYAAAPALLDALEWAESNQPKDDSCETWVSDARAALAKAKGATT